jgi:FkbM family methyltransferase
VVPSSLLDEGCVCCCVGCGEDVSFDAALVHDYGCQVVALDPTPRAIAHVSQASVGWPGFTFIPAGVWVEDATMRFYAPRAREHVSHSILNIQATDEYFEAPVRRLGTVLAELGHTDVTLVKLDIEGAEYSVIESMLEDGISPTVLLVEYSEYHWPQGPGFRSRITDSANALRRHGYTIANVSNGSDYTFVKQGTLGSR